LDVKFLSCENTSHLSGPNSELLIYLRQTMTWKDYAAVTEREEEEVEVKEYGALVGKVLANRMLLFRSSSS